MNKKILLIDFMAYSGFSIIFTETKSKGQGTARVIVTCVGPIGFYRKWSMRRRGDK